MNRFCIIYPPTVSWGEKIYQRPHQILAEFARKGHFSILANKDDDGQGTYWFPMPGLCIANDLDSTLSSPEIRAKMSGATVVFWNSWPKLITMKDNIRPDLTVFDYIDEASEEFSHWQEGLEESIEAANLIVCASDRLYEIIRSKYPHKRTCIVKNGADLHLFQQSQAVLPNDLAQLKHRYTNIIGFHGSLQSWIDYQLIADIAAKRPDWGIVLVGPEYYLETVCKERSNIHFLGHKPYQELHHYVRHFDVGLIPFQVRKLTHSSNPIKMYEYLAAGIPVVATPIHECVQFQPYVRIAHSADEFVQKIGEAIHVTQQERLTYRTIAQQHAWTERVNKILSELRGLRT